MYNPKSSKAEEFIAHEEVLASLEYGEKNKSNVEEIDRILNKAREKKGITHREAMVLLDCDIEEKNQEIYALAKEIKEEFYGNRIVMFAPLYLSNYCINGCEYCPYHASILQERNCPRRRLSKKLRRFRTWDTNALH